MENLVDMIENILEKSNRIQQGFLDRLEANDLRLSRIEGRIQSIENKLEDLYANHNNQLVQIEASARLSAGQNDLIDNLSSYEGSRIYGAAEMIARATCPECCGSSDMNADY